MFEIKKKFSYIINIMEELINLVSELKIKSQKKLTTKCIMARNFLPPQTNNMEMICKEDLQIQNSLTETHGDGILKYEVEYLPDNF